MKNREKRRKWIRILVNTLLIAGILGTGWKISEELIQRKQSADFADSLWKQVTGGSAGGTETRSRSGAEMPEPEERQPMTAGTGSGQAAGGAEAREDAETPAPEERQPMTAGTGSGQAAGEAEAREDAETPAPEERQPMTAGSGQAAGEAEAREDAEMPEPEERQPMTAGTGSGQAAGEAEAREDAETPEPAPSDAPLAGTPAEPEDPAVPEQINFAPLWEISKNAKAWLYSPDTGLSQAVAQTDNNDYYLKHLLDGSFNTAGTLFIDCRNRGDFTDRNTIIYGHSMRNKSMFGRMIQYQEADYCREHPSLYLYTPGHRFRLDIVATFGVRADSAYYTIPVRWAQWKTMLEKGKAKTAWDFGISCGETDHFVTLSTCAYEAHRERWIVIARIADPENVLRETGAAGSAQDDEEKR